MNRTARTLVAVGTTGLLAGMLEGAVRE